MITPQVVAFIKDQDAKGVSREATRILLASKGNWSHANIDEAFAAVPAIYAAADGKTPRPPQVIMVAEPTEPKENPVFAVLAAVLTLALIGAGAYAAYTYVPEIRADVDFVLSAFTGA